LEKGTPVLKLHDVHASYGPVLALRGVTLEVPSGGIVAVLGANGAGKTTTLRAISGLVGISHGSIEFDGERIDKHSPDKIVKLGISQVPEGRQIFTEMSVLDNLRLGAYLRRDSAGIQKDVQRMFGYFPALERRQKQQGGLLSGGEQQMLAIARAMMALPKVLLLDEPSLGLAPMLTREIFSIIKKISEAEGLTILVVEQDAKLALGLAQHGYLLETGAVVLDDDAAAMRENDAVRRSYLGF
jgi:branched-chain amino acid transport system ATP-binding protein